MSAYTVEIRVMPRAALLDPQGQAVQHALQALGFGEVANVRAASTWSCRSRQPRVKRRRQERAPCATVCSPTR